MNPALLRLLMMRLRGDFRMRLVQLTSLRGLFFILAFGGIIWFLIASKTSATEAGLLADSALDRQDYSAQINTFMPLIMLGMSLITAALTTGPTFHFSPTEINFLFTGPFSRRELILYKFGAYAAGVMLSSALITPFAQAQTGSALLAFMASVLTFIFIQLNSAVIIMVGQTLEGSKLARMRYPAIAVLCLAALVALIYAWLTPDLSIFDIMSAFRHSLIGNIILMPYVVFAELFLTTSFFPQLALWGSLAALINAGLLYAVIILDGRTADRSLKENARQSDRWERIKQGGSLWATERTEIRSIRRAPSFGGLGPIAWRQALNVVRDSLKIIIVFIGFALCTGPLASTFGMPATDPLVLMMIYIFFAFILPRTLVCDFRGDLSRMEIYKTLPISPWRICAGQLVVQVCAAYLIALAIIFSIAVFEGGISTSAALTCAALALPFTVLIYAIENTIQLLFPKKLVPMGRADFEFLGRSLVEFIGKTILLLAAAAVSSAIGFFAFIRIQTSLVMFGFVSGLTLTFVGLLMLFIMQFAFRRFAVAENID